MVKKSQKSRPKRVTMGEKYTRIRKAKQKVVKAKRKAKKEGKQRAQQGGRKPQRKDPGVPASWPFKAEFLKEMAFEKARIDDKKKKAKEERYAQKKLLDAEDKDGDGATAMEGIRMSADERQNKFDADQPERESAAATEAGGINRSFYKEFKKVVELADVVIEVLDARDPLPCRSQEVENFVRSCGSEKRIVLLLNKIDLVPREIIEKWLKYLREEMPAVAFKSSTQKQHQNLGQAKKQGLGQKSKTQMCLGAENLLQLLKNYARNKNMKTAITVGIVGVPNVGKSSVINSLKRTRVAHVGNRPGVTTSIQEIHLDKHIRLLDSPGIIASPDQGPLMGCVKTEQIEDPIRVVDGVLSRVSSEKLATIYQVDEFDTAEKFLELLALSRGKLKRGGIPDMVAVAKMVLQDWNNGVIPYYTTPPERNHGDSVRFVQDWAADFDMDEISDEQLLSSVGALGDLEETVAAAMSSLDFNKSSNPALDCALNAVHGLQLLDTPIDENQQQPVKSSKFEGAPEGFDGMIKQSTLRQDVGNVSKGLSTICMDGSAIDVAMDEAGQTDKSAIIGVKPKQKKKKAKVEKQAKVDVIPLPKGLVDDDEGSNDGENDVTGILLQGKRKKPSKKSTSDMYSNEGQLNPHLARLHKKKQKKLKVKKKKSVARMLEDSKLADDVISAVSLTKI